MNSFGTVYEIFRLDGKIGTTKKQATKFSSANFQKMFKSKLYHIENSRTRGQTVQI